MSRPSKKTNKRRTLGEPAARSFETRLLRELWRMVRFVRGRLKTVQTPADATRLGRDLAARFGDAWLRQVLREIGSKAEAKASRPWRRLERVASRRDRADSEYDGEKLLDEWTREAFGRIKSVRSEVAEGLRKDVIEALETGRDPAELAQRWTSKGVPVEFGTLEGRMKVIAQNQLGILHAKVQSERARAVGVRSFVWRTQGDDRVRDKHRRLADEEFKYDDPPSEGLPGQPINCRCWAESVIPDEMLEASGFGFGVAPEQRPEPPAARRPRKKTSKKKTSKKKTSKKKTAADPHVSWAREQIAEGSSFIDQVRGLRGQSLVRVREAAANGTDIAKRLLTLRAELERRGELRLGVREPSSGLSFSTEPPRDGQTVVWVDPAEVDRRWTFQRVEPDGTGQIGNRIQAFEEFLESDPDIEPAQIALNEKGEIEFLNGRHRFAVFRKRGVKKIPIAIDKAQAAELRRLAGVKAPGERVPGGQRGPAG